jgi:hypothetical protein
VLFVVTFVVLAIGKRLLLKNTGGAA